MSKKTLIAYFSVSGNTGRVAKFLANYMEADMYEIKPAQPYTKADLDWHDKKSRSSVEMHDEAARPEIEGGEIPKWEEYEVVFLGFPIWWYVEPRIINTFLESHDFNGKIIVPFCTSSGSDVGELSKHLTKEKAPSGSTLRPAKCLNKLTRKMVEDWLVRLKL